MACCLKCGVQAKAALGTAACHHPAAQAASPLAAAAALTSVRRGDNAPARRPDRCAFADSAGTAPAHSIFCSPSGVFSVTVYARTTNALRETTVDGFALKMRLAPGPLKVTGRACSEDATAIIVAIEWVRCSVGKENQCAEDELSATASPAECAARQGRVRARMSTGRGTSLPLKHR